MNQDPETPWTDKLREYRALKAAGEDYPDCPRCDGERYETAFPASEIDAYSPRSEEYPCPLCVTVATIDIDKAIDWLLGKAMYYEEYEENNDGID